MDYRVMYALAWINAAIGVVAGALTTTALAFHPSWLTADVAATAAVVVTITVGLAQILPPLTRTPAQRDDKYIAALAGALPEDIAKRKQITPLQPNSPPTG